MKALVLSGGAGTRLWPITHTSAKQLVPVANKPVLFYGLESIAEAGVTEVGIIVGDTADEIRQAIGDGSQFGIKVTYITQEAPLGLAHAVIIARDFLADDDFVMYLGDNFIVGGIRDLVERFRRERPDAQILLAQVANPRSFGVAEIDEASSVIGLEEKPERPKSDLALVGVYLFRSCVHEAVRSIEPSRRGELEITHAIQWLIEQGKDVRSTTIHGYWKDTGNVTDMLEVNRTVLETLERSTDADIEDGNEIIGRVHIDPTAKVTGSRIVGPAIIGADSIVHNSYVGPFTSISEGCRIENSEVEYSILLRNSSLIGISRIEASLIGRNVEVTTAPQVPAAHRLIVGDYSKVQISS